MSANSVFVYSEEVSNYRFSKTHPFNPTRLELTVDLLREMGLLTAAQISSPRMATEEEILTVHEPSYVQMVRTLGRYMAQQRPDRPLDQLALWDFLEGEQAHLAAKLAAAQPFRSRFDAFDRLGETYGLGTEDNPLFPHMHEAASLVVGGTLCAAEAVMEGKAQHALNLSGGLHHAHRDKASGFCLYNDAAVAIRLLRERYDARVLYIDTDAHHGDGVQWIFYEDPNVLTLSIHETGRFLFPGTGGLDERGSGAGYGYSLNLPLDPFTEDDSWLELAHHLLPRAAHFFQPDVIVSQNGCDAHHDDPLTHLAVSTRVYRDIPKLVHRLAHDYCEGRWVAVGGGGYDIWRVVPRAWSFLWSEMTDRRLSGEEVLPPAWVNRWQKEAPVTLPERFLDMEIKSIPRRSEIEANNRQILQQLLRQLP